MPIQCLFDQIGHIDNYIKFNKKDSNGRVGMLFIAPRNGIDLWRRYQQVWIGDASYKLHLVILAESKWSPTLSPLHKVETLTTQCPL